MDIRLLQEEIWKEKEKFTLCKMQGTIIIKFETVEINPLFFPLVKATRTKHAAL